MSAIINVCDGQTPREARRNHSVICAITRSPFEGRLRVTAIRAPRGIDITLGYDHKERCHVPQGEHRDVLSAGTSVFTTPVHVLTDYMPEHTAGDVWTPSPPTGGIAGVESRVPWERDRDPWSAFASSPDPATWGADWLPMFGFTFEDLVLSVRNALRSSIYPSGIPDDVAARYRAMVEHIARAYTWPVVIFCTRVGMHAFGEDLVRAHRHGGAFGTATHWTTPVDFRVAECLTLAVRALAPYYPASIAAGAA